MLTIDEARGCVVVLNANGTTEASIRHVASVRGGLGRMAALRLGYKVRPRLHLAGTARDPTSGGHDPHSGGDLACPTRRGGGNRRGPRWFADLLCEHVRGDGPRTRHRHRCGHPRVQPGCDRGAPTRRARHAGGGQFCGCRHAGCGAAQHRTDGERSGDPQLIPVRVEPDSRGDSQIRGVQISMVPSVNSREGFIGWVKH